MTIPKGRRASAGTVVRLSSRLKPREQTWEAERKVHASKHTQYPRVKQRSETDVQSNCWMKPIVACQRFFVFLNGSQYANRTCFESNTGRPIFLFVFSASVIPAYVILLLRSFTYRSYVSPNLLERSEFGSQIDSVFLQILIIIFS